MQQGDCTIELMLVIESKRPLIFICCNDISLCRNRETRNGRIEYRKYKLRDSHSILTLNSLINGANKASPQSRKTRNLKPKSIYRNIFPVVVRLYVCHPCQ